MLNAELKSKISQLWDKFWAGGIANPLTAIEQISYLVFMKRLEDLDMQHENQAIARKEKFVSVFKGNEDCRWSNWKHYSSEQMIQHVRDKVFPFIKEIRRGEDTLFSENMKDAVFIIPKPSLLQEAVSIIDELYDSALTANGDTLGDIYEYLLKEIQTSGKNGQFRTPRHIIRMMVELVNPKIGETVCDPACGTSGFLINCYYHILEKNTSKDSIKYDEDGTPHNLIGDKIGTNKKAWSFLKRNTFFGFDVDTTMVRIALMNMILHGIENPNIKYADSLSKNFDLIKQFDVVLANPPFTGSIDKTDINDVFKLDTTKTELLFIELFYNLLEQGGRAAIIVPNGVLFGNSNAHKSARKLLLEKCQLEAVISMPSGVFKPYSGVGTAVLVFTKGNQTDSVWFYDMKADGFSLDDKRNFIDGKGNIPDITKKFKTKEISENSIKVPFKKIKENDFNLSISAYQEVKFEEIKYESPKKIIEKTLKLEEEITKELKELKKMV